MEPAMKYLLLVCRDEKSLNAMPPGEWNALVRETNAYLDTLRKSGHYVASEALESVETATTVQIRNGKLSTTDGPFAETKEQIGGFILVEAPNLDEAIRIAAEFPPARHGKVEVRPVRDFTARSSTLPRSEG